MVSFDGGIMADKGIIKYKKLFSLKLYMFQTLTWVEEYN